MNLRTKILLAVAIALAAGLLMYTVGYKPWSRKKEALEADILKTERGIGVAKNFLGKVEGDWKTLETQLRDPQRTALVRGPDLYVLALVDKMIADENRKPKGLTPLPDNREGDFVERSVDVKNARFRVDEFAKFLVEIHNAREFLRIRRLAISTQYDRPDNVVTVEFQASTLVYEPGAKRKP